MKPDIDRMIRDYHIRLDDAGVLHWTTVDAPASAQIRALKREIAARLREFEAHVMAANVAYVRQKAIERIVQFIPPSPAERTMAARRKPAEERMAEAKAMLSQWQAAGWEAEVWFDPCQVVDRVHGRLLAVPSRLLPEVLWLLWRINKPIQHHVPGPGPHWLDAPAGGGAA